MLAGRAMPCRARLVQIERCRAVRPGAPADCRGRSPDPQPFRVGRPPHTRLRLMVDVYRAMDDVTKDGGVAAPVRVQMAKFGLVTIGVHSHGTTV